MPQILSDILEDKNTELETILCILVRTAETLFCKSHSNIGRFYIHSVHFIEIVILFTVI